MAPKSNYAAIKSNRRSGSLHRRLGSLKGFLFQPILEKLKCPGSSAFWDLTGGHLPRAGQVLLKICIRLEVSGSQCSGAPRWGCGIPMGLRRVSAELHQSVRFGDTASPLGACPALSALLGPQANALGWKEEEVAIGAPLQSPPMRLFSTGVCGSSRPPLVFRKRYLTQLWKHVFLEDARCLLCIILAAFLQSEPCKRRLPCSSVGTKGICFRREDLAARLCSTELLG